MTLGIGEVRPGSRASGVGGRGCRGGGVGRREKMWSGGACVWAEAAGASGDGSESQEGIDLTRTSHARLFETREARRFSQLLI